MAEKNKKNTKGQTRLTELFFDRLKKGDRNTVDLIMKRLKEKVNQGR